MPDQIAPDALETEEGRHATNLELFLDLVFVFAVTQVAGGSGRVCAASSSEGRVAGCRS